MSAYSGEWRVISEQPVPPELLAQARKLIGSMQDSGTPQRGVKNADGSTVHVTLVNGVPKVTITQESAEGKGEDALHDMWVPRGFAVYPAWHDAPGGMGLPIVQLTDGGKTPYSAANLAPGLKRERWTAGGPCGEVLISKDKDAGYPPIGRTVPVPLLFHPTLGPVFHWGGGGYYDARATKGKWTSYRMELDAPHNYYPDESADNALGLLDEVNHARGAVPRLNLLPRGYYRNAQVMCSIMKAAGGTTATASGYPATYKSVVDRLTKDGFPATAIAVTGDVYTRDGIVPGYEFRHLGGTPTSVVDSWSSDITLGLELLADTGDAGFMDVGFRGGFWCASLVTRSSWIAAGNARWKGADAGLPTISWCSFASINLSWETYPMIYDAANWDATPLMITYNFTTPAGNCWLNYPRSKEPNSTNLDPALSRYVYSRGRAIGVAPRGGLIWAAGILANGAHDRLIILVHHPEDQPTDSLHEGFTRYLRVWWVDIPKRGSLRADPPSAIIGELADDPWGWRGGADKIDVGVMPSASGLPAGPGPANSLRYASCWRFSPDGSHAVCLRDYAAYLDYGVFGKPLPETPVGETPPAQFVPKPRTVELTFSISTSGLDTLVSFHDYLPGQRAPASQEVAPPGYEPLPYQVEMWRSIGSIPLTPDYVQNDPIVPMNEHGAEPLAVDYADNGELVYALVGTVSNSLSWWFNPRAPGAYPGNMNSIADYVYSYVGTGTADTMWTTQIDRMQLQGAAYRTMGTNFRNVGLHVLDVRKAAFLVEGILPRTMFVTPIDHTFDFPAPPLFPFTEQKVHGVRVLLDGREKSSAWYAAPDGEIFTHADPGNSLTGSFFGYLVLGAGLCVSKSVQGYYADAYDVSIIGYQVSPVPQASEMAATQTSAEGGHWMDYSELNPRGGAVASTVPLPSNDWLIYAKVI